MNVQDESRKPNDALLDALTLGMDWVEGAARVDAPTCPRGAQPEERYAWVG